MRLTPPTNTTFGLSAVFGVVAVALNLTDGFSASTIVALVGLAVLVVGNVYGKI